MSYKTDIIPLDILASQYCALGISKAQVVHFVADCRLRSDGGYGKGNKAAKREAQIITHKTGLSWEFCDQLNARLHRARTLPLPNKADPCFSHAESDQQNLEQF